MQAPIVRRPVLYSLTILIAKVCILDASGPAFSAGHDLKEIKRLQDSHASSELQELFSECSNLMQYIQQVPFPVIAKVNGIATAAGCQLVATVDMAIASDSSRFALPGVNIGLFCSTPLVAVSRVISRKHALEMALTGDVFPASYAHRVGLINTVVSEEDLEPSVLELASRISRLSSQSIAMGKPCFYKQESLGLEEAYQVTSRIMTQNSELSEAREGISALLGKRPPSYQ